MMSTGSPGVYLDLPVLLDYIRTHIPECADTRKAVDSVDNQGAYVEISEKVYDYWEKSALDAQRLLKFLKQKAEEYRHQGEYGYPEEAFASGVLDIGYLNEKSEIPFDIGSAFEDEIEAHRQYLKDVGIRKYTVYLKQHLRICSKAHQKLDGIIDNRYGPGGRDRKWAKMRLEECTDSDIHLSSLVDGHYWCKSGGELFLVRDGNRGDYSLSDLEAKLLHNTNSGVSIMSPTQVVDNFI